MRSLYHIWPGNAFIMFDRMVMVETYSAELTITQPRELALYAKAFALLHRAAVYGSPARDLITVMLLISSTLRWVTYCAVVNAPEKSATRQHAPRCVHCRR
jgi:hypothetical protein